MKKIHTLSQQYNSETYLSDKSLVLTCDVINVTMIKIPRLLILLNYKRRYQNTHNINFFSKHIKLRLYSQKFRIK